MLTMKTSSILYYDDNIPLLPTNPNVGRLSLISYYIVDDTYNIINDVF